ncbi:barstar family protein [Actinacidiphila acididurans]|uniref:Barstar family protein n=1 Tax=Actinacidiphila acididurans TaxID=2784346 RepID=A0ABS2TRU1_9ACTN|nr:barstar family protein [Actinacidiphila acididurans]MBM9506049.1 barstar family protein [Actinacidiphila acididurans]
MIPFVQVDETPGGQARYTLTDAEDGHVWGVCSEVEGLFGEPERGMYELFGWVAEGAEVLRGWVGSRVWLVPEDETFGPWLLEDGESLGRHTGTDGLVLTGLDDYLGPRGGHRGPVRVHDERRWLGSCREFTRVLPPERGAPPLVLRGLAPGDELLRRLRTGTRRALDLDQVALEIRDQRGEWLTQLLLTTHVRASRPSARGADLIDLELDSALFTPVAGHARPVWDRWLAGPPQTPGAWAGLDTRARGVWLDLVRESGCQHGRHDRPAGHAYELDGRQVTDVPGLYLALGEAVNGPGGYFGGNLDALADCLRGTFGYTSPATLLWRDAATARRHLSDALTSDGRPYDLFTAVLDVLAQGGMHVTLA